MSAVGVSLGSTLLFFSVFVFVSAVQINITAESGQDVALPCRVTNKITAVEWSRAGLGQKNVFLYQDGRFVPNNQHPSYKNRVALRGMKDGDASLIVKKATTADSGTYKCLFKIAETRSWKNITINLRIPPDRSGPSGTGSIGVIVGLIVAGVAAAAGLSFCRKQKPQSPDSFQPPDDQD
ncbi:butyrophilin-like protein 10 [Maylandia zebra]|uniref:butyrophilin-like protein 10 n=1 Tax=Maylandia zebra TaxID=106582 RepID=UPI00403D03E9